MNRPLSSLHEGSLETTLTVPLNNELVKDRTNFLNYSVLSLSRFSKKKIILNPNKN